jgi:hypothetical protein
VRVALRPELIAMGNERPRKLGKDERAIRPRVERRSEGDDAVRIRWGMAVELARLAARRRGRRRHRRPRAAARRSIRCRRLTARVAADRRKQKIVELGSKLRNRNRRRHFNHQILHICRFHSSKGHNTMSKLTRH